MKKLFTLVCAAILSVSMFAAVDLTQGASFDFNALTADDFANLDESDENAYWKWNSNGYYGNTTKFAASTALDFQLNAAGDIIAGLEGLKFINNGAGKARIYVGTDKKPQKGLYFDSGSSKLVLPSLKADQVITITYANASDSEAGFTVTNADAEQNATTHTETLTVKADGDVTVTYASNKFYLLTINIAAWVAPTTYTVTYKANNGTEEEDIVDGEAKKVAECTFTAPTGKAFGSWNTKADGEGIAYAPGTKVESDLTLYAQWENLCAVTFNLQGHGDAVEAQSIKKGSKVTKPSDPFTLDDFVFDGWYKEAACENEWDFANDVVNVSTELFAKWRTACFETIYSLTGGIGSAEVTAATATVTEEALSMSDTNGRITLTPKSGAAFKNNDNIILIGTVGNSSRPFGVKIGSQTIQTTDVIPNDPEQATAGGSAKVQGFLSLTEDKATIAIGRAGGTTTTLTTCVIRREVECGGTALDNTDDVVKATKRIVNGQLIIEKNGEVYNVLGARVR